MTNEAVKQVFDRTSASYDNERARLLPGFEALYGAAIHLLPAHAANILDLGAGTGLLSAAILAQHPSARLHLVDLSESMLVQARMRFAANPNITFEHADYSAMSALGHFDAIVSALSIHHLSHPAKRLLFRSIHAALAPAGVFINLEQVLGPTPALEAYYRSDWMTQVRALGASEQQIADSLVRQQQDRCATVEEQLAWMREAGFAGVDCWFKQGRFAVLTATRAAGTA